MLSLLDLILLAMKFLVEADDDDELEFREWLKLPSVGETPRDGPTTSTWHEALPLMG